MTDRPSASRASHARKCDLASGDRVKIRAGRLAGLAGTVANLRDQGNCLLEIDNWPEGVYVVVRRELLQRV
jgi:hypothetical protein